MRKIEFVTKAQSCLHITSLILNTINNTQNEYLIFTDDFLLDTTPISSITPAVRCSDSCPADRLDDSCCDSSSGLLSGIIEEPETVKERYYYCI